MFRKIYNLFRPFFRNYLTKTMKNIIEKEGTVQVRRELDRYGQRCLETVYWFNAQTYRELQLDIGPVTSQFVGPTQANLRSVSVKVFDVKRLTSVELVASSKYKGSLKNPEGLGIICIRVMGAHEIGRATIV